MDPTEAEAPAGAGIQYYKGHGCTVQRLAVSDVRALYSRPDVVAAFAAYRPQVGDAEHRIDVVASRLEWLSQLDPPVEVETLVRHVSGGRPIGFLCLSAIDFHNQKAEILAAFFSQQATRAGLEAVHWLVETAFSAFPFQKLVLHVAPDNLPARRLIHALGAEREALLRSELRRSDGSRADIERHALFRERWLTSADRARLRKLVPLRPQEPLEPAT